MLINSCWIYAGRCPHLLTSCLLCFCYSLLETSVVKNGTSWPLQRPSCLCRPLEVARPHIDGSAAGQKCWWRCRCRKMCKAKWLGPRIAKFVWVQLITILNCTRLGTDHEVSCHLWPLRLQLHARFRWWTECVASGQGYLSHLSRNKDVTVSARGDDARRPAGARLMCRAGLPETNWDLTSQYTPKNGNMGFKHIGERDLKSNYR